MKFYPRAPIAKIAYLANIRSDTYNESFAEAVAWLMKLDRDDINELYLEFKGEEA